MKTQKREESNTSPIYTVEKLNFHSQKIKSTRDKVDRPNISEFGSSTDT